MPKKDIPESEPMQTLRAIAMALPEAEEGTSCNNCAFHARKKNFFFMGHNEETYNVRVKLKDAVPEAEKLAAKQPEQYDVGMHGWVKATFAHGEAPPQGLMDRWITESFRLIAPKKLVAELDAK